MASGSTGIDVQRARARAETVALVTCAAVPDLSLDDRLLADALRGIGATPVPAIWDDPLEAWRSYDVIVLRSCWDYPHKPDAFRRWLSALERSGARVRNDVATVRWNMEKTYLRDLAARGIPVMPTHWVSQGTRTTLADVTQSSGWSAAVVKPVISNSAYETWTVDGITDELERRFSRMVAERDVMIQPFVEAIRTAGELSLIFLAGRFSHAVRKRPKPGDFRVQTEFGGSADRVEVSEALVRQASAAVAAAPSDPLYARVDGFVDNGGTFVLMELELMEPWLFLSVQEGSADRLAEAIVAAPLTRAT